MQWPAFFRKKKNDHYLGLLLKEDQGIVTIIDRKESIGRLIDFERFDYTNSWEQLIEDVDEILFRLESKHKLHLEETIFFVFSHLIDKETNQIKKPYQGVIKNLAKNLELRPLGFIDCREAVIKTIEQKEEMSPTGILIELDKNNVSVYVYKAGQVVFNKIVSKTDNLVDDLELVFNELRGKILLPARIILYNSGNLDNEATRILSHRWSADLFTQLPKIEIIQEKEILASLVEIFSEQINRGKERIEQPFAQKTKTGFIIGEDIKITEKEELSEPKDSTTSLLMGFKNLFKKIKIPLPISFSMKNNWSKRILLLAGPIIIGLSLFINEYYLHKAKLEIFVPSLNLKSDLTVSIADTGKVDLLVKPIIKTSDLSTMKSATGKKEVGEQAKGEVTVYNFSKEKVFSKGTKIETKGITFVFDDDLNVASASLTTDGSAKLPGKNKVKVTASLIGEEGNLAKDQTFKVEDLDPEVYFAKNEGELSGGSKKQITTISKQDYQDLETELLKKGKNQKQIELKFDPDEKVINQLTKTELKEENFSKEIGEEAPQVTLTAKVKTTLYVYKKSKLIDLIFSYLEKEKTSGFTLDKDRISYQINRVEEKKGQDYLKISSTGKAIKTVDKNQAIKILIGKDKSDVEKILQQTYSITGYNLDLRQPLPLPFLNQRLPFFPKNFEIKFDSL